MLPSTTMLPHLFINCVHIITNKKHRYILPPGPVFPCQVHPHQGPQDFFATCLGLDVELIQEQLDPIFNTAQGHSKYVKQGS